MRAKTQPPKFSRKLGQSESERLKRQAGSLSLRFEVAQLPGWVVACQVSEE